MSNETLKGDGGVSPETLPSLLDKYVISRDENPVPAKYKIIRSGLWLEIYEYDEPIWINVKRLPREPLPLTDTQIMDCLLGNVEKPSDELIKIRQEITQQRRVNRARTNMRRLIQTNFDQAGKLLTLTFRDTDVFDISSLSDCHPRLTYFYKNLRKQFPDSKFVSVPEFQKRGAVHYHLILNLPFVPVDSIRSMWPYGFIKINKIHNPAKVGAYVAKYLAKNVTDPRFAHHRCYSSSLNLQKPQVDYAVNLDQVFALFQQQGVTSSFDTKFYAQFRGLIKYSSYNLYQTAAQKQES